MDANGDDDDAPLPAAGDAAARAGASVRALRDLKARMAKARDDRTRLKRLLGESEFLFESHHATYALENVTIDRRLEATNDGIAEMEKVVRDLQHDVEYAEGEHRRLTKHNEGLLRLVREKERELRMLTARQNIYAACEKKAVRLEATVRATVEAIAAKTKRVGVKSHRLLGAVGDKHVKVMSLEQRMIDLKLEVDSWRHKLGLPPRLNDITLPYAPIMNPCLNPECQRARQQLAQLQEPLQYVRLKRALPAPPPDP